MAPAMQRAMKFVCATCRDEHDLDEISFGAEAPEQWRLLTEEEQARSELSSDQCVVESKDGRHFFVRACLDLPIRGTDRQFTWGVWVSLSEKSFLEMSERWNDPRRVETGPFFGWLCTNISVYPDTMLLKTMVHQRAVGLRPLVVLEPTDHPLAIHQRDGIESGQLQQMVAELLHG